MGKLAPSSACFLKLLGKDSDWLSLGNMATSWATLVAKEVGFYTTPRLSYLFPSVASRGGGGVGEGGENNR